MRRTLACLTLLVATGCSFSAHASFGSGDPTVAKADLEKELASQAKDQGLEADKVTCDGSLKGKVGSTQHCTVDEPDNTSVGVTVTTTSVDGTDVHFSIKDDDPNLTAGISSASLEQKVSDQLAAQVGHAPASVSCPDKLDGVVGTVERCTLTDTDGTVYGLSVTVTTVQGTDIHFDIKVDSEPTPSG